jgi:hypothetical protein
MAETFSWHASAARAALVDGSGVFGFTINDGNIVNIEVLVDQTDSAGSR